MSASCKPRVQLLADAANGWPHSALRYHSSCQSAVTCPEIVNFLVTSLACVKSKYQVPGLYF